VSAAPGGSKMPSNKINPDGSFDRAALQAGVDPEDGSGTSIFDPVLCELAYRWFCPPGGRILDPFAGGSVRGIVAGALGRGYLGIDLRAEQIAANEIQRLEILSPKQQERVGWIVGDSREKLTELLNAPSAPLVDFLFGCPPYGDLEVYSDDPLDLSTMDFGAFETAYMDIIAKACALLKPDRFACFVVGDYRDPKGMYRDFPGLTIQAFRDAGLALYNEAILITAVGSLPIRARKMFEASRKLGKTHQNFYVFVKGDPKKATEAIGAVEFGDLSEIAGAATAGELAGVEPL
jgi:DNA modification methylase